MAGSLTNIIGGAMATQAQRSPFLSLLNAANGLPGGGPSPTADAAAAAPPPVDTSGLATAGASVGPIAAQDAAGAGIQPPPVGQQPPAPTPGYVDPVVSSVASRKSQSGPQRPAGSGESYAFNYFLSKNIPPAAAAGIVGNLYQESAFSDDVLTGRRRGDNGRSAFAAQWQGARLRNLEAFARSRGETVPSLDTQLDFVLEEGTPGSNYADPGAVKALRMLRDPNKVASSAQAADIFRDYYERPSADDRASRRKHAARVAGVPVDENFAARGTSPASPLERVLGAATGGATSLFGGVPAAAGRQQTQRPQTAMERVMAFATQPRRPVQQTQAELPQVAPVEDAGAEEVAALSQAQTQRRLTPDQRAAARKQSLTARTRYQKNI